MGSIDNAVPAHSHETYYLIFTDSEIYQFMTMDSRERRYDLYHAQMSNPYLMLTGGMGMTGYRLTQDEVAAILQENLARGKEIEKNFESKIKENPPSYEIIPYSTVSQAELTNGTLVTLPHLLLHTGDKEIKFHLVHDNYKGRGKLSEETFTKYKEVLKNAFGGALIVKN